MKVQNQINIFDYIFKIQRYSIHDGPGIRTTLFFKGCPLSCSWCHNPESQAMPKKADKKNIKHTAAILMKEIEKDLIFYDESNGGVTFSGGEPLVQHELLFELLDQCRKKDIHSCVDTSGFAPFDILKTAAQKTDIILYDIKIVNDYEHHKYTGQSAGMVLDNLKKLSEEKISLKVRFPLIPEMTDKEDNINSIIKFLKTNTVFNDIHVLPFHKAGEGKYEKLKLENQLKNIKPPSKERVDEVIKKFESKGFATQTGG